MFLRKIFDSELYNSNYLNKIWLLGIELFTQIKSYKISNYLIHFYSEPHIVL